MKLQVGKLYRATHRFWIGNIRTPHGSISPQVKVDTGDIVMIVKNAHALGDHGVLLFRGNTYKFSKGSGLAAWPEKFFERVTL